MDLKIIDEGNGGDLVFISNDLQLTAEVYNQPYLARFGGNLENSTTDEFKEGDIHGDWWGNDLMLSKPNEQFNSKFEAEMNRTSLNIAGRKSLEKTAKADIAYLAGFADVNTSVQLPSINKVRLIDNVVKGDNTSFTYIWNDAKTEIL